MNKKSELLFYSFFILIALFFVEIGFLHAVEGMKKESIKTKGEFVELLKLPDLAISTEATYVRHRSLSDLFSIYKDDGSLREYFTSTYVFSHSNIINAKSTHEK